MRRVLGDLFRELRWAVLGVLTVLTIGGLVLVSRGPSVGLARWLNYAALGADLAVFQITSTSTDALRMMRWIFAVPIRRRDIGRGLWFVTVIAPASLTVAAKVLLLGLGSVIAPNVVTLRWVASSSLFDVAFEGSLCWLLLQATRRKRTPAPRWLARVSWILILTVCLGGALTLGWYMPSAATAWSWPVGGALAGMLALTVAGYRQSERLAIDGGMLDLLFGHSPDGDAGRVPAVRMAFAGRLSGPRRMLWEQFRFSALVQLVIMIVLSFMGAFPLDRKRGFVEQSLEMWADPDMRPMFWVMGWVICLSLGNNRWRPSRIAVLRVLPMSGQEINQLLLLRPVVTWLALWLVALPFWSLAGAGYPWLGVGTLVAMMGLTAVTCAALLRWQRNPLSMFAVMAVNYGLLFGHPWKYVHIGIFDTVAGQLALFALGLAGLRATHLWHARLLTRSSAAYVGSP